MYHLTPIDLYVASLPANYSKRQKIRMCFIKGYSDIEIKRYFYLNNDWLAVYKKEAKQ